jgi:putative DNA primase/helicase
LENDRFAPARLYGRLANICPDLPGSHLEDSAVFKAITGGDRITGELKYRDAFEFRPFARLIFSANHFPAARYGSQSYFDRWLLIPFERRFRGFERRRAERRSGCPFVGSSGTQWSSQSSPAGLTTAAHDQSLQ